VGDDAGGCGVTPLSKIVVLALVRMILLSVALVLATTGGVGSLVAGGCIGLFVWSLEWGRV
jgi:hypothetical protein